MIELSLCNELLAAEGKSISEQCHIAAALGYMGLELSPATLSESPERMPASAVHEIRSTVNDHGLVITGLHWLLAPYPQLSITQPDVAAATQDVLIRLIDLTVELGGRVLVHGSPNQRRPPDGEAMEETVARVINFFRPIAAHAKASGVVYCLEPLAPNETSFVNTVAQAAAIVKAIDTPAFRTMIDTSAAGQSERETVATLIRDWVPTGLIGHVQANDTNRGAPGTGDDPFPNIVRALRDVDWRQPIAIEPFTVTLDATATAAVGAATLRACWGAV